MKRGIYSKKAQGLSLNVVILAILVLLVLIVLAAFFLGGTSKLTSEMKSIFGISTAGTDIQIALEACKQYCGTGSAWADNLKSNSPYCKKTFNLDLNGDGEAEQCPQEGRYVAYHCWGSTLNVPCPALEESCIAQSGLEKTTIDQSSCE